MLNFSTPGARRGAAVAAVFVSVFTAACSSDSDGKTDCTAAFKQAIQCFDLSISLRQKLIADIQAGPGTDATKTRLAASHQRTIDAAMADREECRQNVSALERRGTQ